MDHFVDKELSGQSHTKSCSQWLYVQLETSDELRSSGIGIGTSAL